ncbi:MAG: IS21 family transposase [Verrucomicrobia bacterium]|nr:IS21 family transposase [Verrucomicrobiota bacterium]
MDESTRNDIIRMFYSRTSQRRIAKKLGVDRKTVAQVIADHQATRTGAAPEKRKPRKSLVDPFQDNIVQLLERYPDITAVRMLEELRRLGFTGAYSIVRDRLRQLRRRPRLLIQRFETARGVQGQMDYSPYDIDFTAEGKRRVNAFSYVLGYSRRQYLYFVERQDFTTTIRQHVAAFTHLRGLAAECLYDNMKVVVSGYDGEQPIYNTRFLAFATYYGFRPVACRPRRPETKGKVERQFQLVETNLLNGRTFSSLQHLNETTAWWLAHVADVRLHKTTQRTPLDLYQEELPHLLPLPEKLRHGRGRLSHRESGRLCPLLAKLVFRSLAAHRRTAAGAHHGNRTHRLRSRHPRDRPPCAAAGFPHTSAQHPSATSARP